MFQANLDISQLARENEILKEYIHINELLIDLTLEYRRILNAMENTVLPNLEREIAEKIEIFFNTTKNRIMKAIESIFKKKGKIQKKKNGKGGVNTHTQTKTHEK